MTSEMTAEQAIEIIESSHNNCEGVSEDDLKAIANFIHQQCKPVEGAEVRGVLATYDDNDFAGVNTHDVDELLAKLARADEVRPFIERLAHERDEANDGLAIAEHKLSARIREVAQQAAEIERLKRVIRLVTDNKHLRIQLEAWLEPDELATLNAADTEGE